VDTIQHIDNSSPYQCGALPLRKLYAYDASNPSGIGWSLRSVIADKAGMAEG